MNFEIDSYYTKIDFYYTRLIPIILCIKNDCTGPSYDRLNMALFSL